jgi:hypothetical protein
MFEFSDLSFWIVWLSVNDRNLLVKNKEMIFHENKGFVKKN